MKKLLLSILAALMLMMGFSMPAFAAGAEQIDSIENEYNLDPEGTLHVKENITYTFEGQRNGLMRSLSERSAFGASKFRIYPHSNFKVLQDGQPVQFTEEVAGSFVNLKIGDPANPVSGTHVYTITYDVKNTVATSEDGTQGFTWNPSGNNWQVPVKSIKATFNNLPGTSTPPVCTPVAVQCTVVQEGTATVISALNRPFDITMSFPANSFPGAQVMLINNPLYTSTAEEEAAKEGKGSVFLTILWIGLGALLVIGIGITVNRIRKNSEESATATYGYTSTPTTTEPKEPVERYLTKEEIALIAANLAERGHIYSTDSKGEVLSRRGEEFLSPMEHKILDEGFARLKNVTATQFSENLQTLQVFNTDKAYITYLSTQKGKFSGKQDSSSSSSSTSSQRSGYDSNYYNSGNDNLLLSVLLFSTLSPNVYHNTTVNNVSDSSVEDTSSTSYTSSSYDTSSTTSYDSSSYDSGSYSSDSGSSSSSDGGSSW